MHLDLEVKNLYDMTKVIFLIIYRNNFNRLCCVFYDLFVGVVYIVEIKYF